MIDLHTHIWDIDNHFNDSFKAVIGQSFMATPSAIAECPPATPDIHWAASQRADKVIVLAFDMWHSGAVVPNEYVASYVKAHTKRLIGFASVDPNRADALDILDWAHKGLNCRGLMLSSPYQNFHPNDQWAYPLYHYCQTHNLPILVHQGATIIPQAPLMISQPILLEQVAYDFPKLKIIIAHLGFPWTTDTIALMCKQANVNADLSALCYHPWQLYNALLMAMEAKVAEKIFFGSDWPFTTIEQTVSALRQLCKIGEGTSLPSIPQSLVDEIIHQNPLPELGLE